jgi:hypothetical protein
MRRYVPIYDPITRMAKTAELPAVRLLLNSELVNGADARFKPV